MPLLGSTTSSCLCTTANGAFLPLLCFLLLGISINYLCSLQGEYKTKLAPQSALLRSHRAPAASASLHPLLQLLFWGAERRDGWRGGDNPGVGRKAEAAEPLGRSSPRKHRKGFGEPGEEELGWGRNVEPWQTLVTPGWESKLRWVSHPLAPEPYLAPTLLSLYVFLPS